VTSINMLASRGGSEIPSKNAASLAMAFLTHEPRPDLIYAWLASLKFVRSGSA